jgi:hypothetical protein
LSPTNPGPNPNRHPGDRDHGIRAKLTGRGCDDLHRTGPGPGPDNHRGPAPAAPWPGELDPTRAVPGELDPTRAVPGELDPTSAALPGELGRPSAAWPGDLAGPDADGLGGPDADGLGGLATAVDPVSGANRPEAARRFGRERVGGARARFLGSAAGDVPSPRPGWYAYRVIGPAQMPSWATEVALTIERPADPGPEGVAELARAATRSGLAGPGGPEGGARAGPCPPEPRVPSPMPDHVGALAGGWVGQVQAMVLLRASGWPRWLAGAAEAAVEVETAAGLRPVAGGDRVNGGRPWFGSRPRSGPALPGLLPVAPPVAHSALGVAGARGLPAPMRRWRPVVGGLRLSWRSSAGSVLTCEGPCGVSAQAVVALRGLGSVAALTPPPGGALVLRAWRARRSWGVACGLVLGASSALGLGREAGRVAAKARAEGWDAHVLGGATALHVARAGDPDLPPPEAAGRAATGPRVAALFEACLAAGGLDRPPTGPRWALAVTP